MKQIGNGKSGALRKRVGLDEWMREAFVGSNDGARVTMVALEHVISSGNTVEVPPSMVIAPGTDPSIVAKVMRARADTYSQDLVGVQQFTLLVFYDNSDEPGAKLPFSATGRQDFDGATEAPTKEGLTAQQMRHVETAMGAAFAMIEKLNERFMQQSDRDQKRMDMDATRIARLQDENVKMFDYVRNVYVQQMKSDHDKAMEHAAFVRATEERAKLMQMAPVLVNSITGREVFPQSTADTVLIDRLAESLLAKPELIEFLTSSGVVPDSLMGPLMQRLEISKNKMEAEAHAQAALTPPVADPIAEAAGDVQP